MFSALLLLFSRRHPPQITPPRGKAEISEKLTHDIYHSSQPQNNYGGFKAGEKKKTRLNYRNRQITNLYIVKKNN